MLKIIRKDFLYKSLLLNPYRYGKLPTVQLSPIVSSSRAYSKRPITDAREDAPSFKKIFLIGIVGTVIFVAAARSLDKNQPKTSYSAEEYEQVMKGLRRRVTLFKPGELEVIFVPTGDLASVQKYYKKDLEKMKYIEPKEIVNLYRNRTDGKYQALLEDIWEMYADDSVNNLPPGLLVSLLESYMKETCQIGDKVVITNFPRTMKDAIKFESEVSVITNIIIPRNEADSDICRYYDTVSKVKRV
ncbi:hypothetical protein KAFR_0B04930 [Kazachstania africana CBS 2517]|uniref:Altered inheritance of mitochondria protein 36, mitochondrial n=1 Tax=Kazachstania africana (strain ATCC 22294 / BCRC 22015 / CBS 2517 / CECT 1963 / NBRC 1671 / NRRL Y-8276) TaxID=1071382 RepID=H2AQY9_KAZAF|nr:hypothetical protein KAFR_0B04930 [Kazachstania africana CBS 2517]CCF56789.1 hypothetical protein KAFR_0B04930 [Kazachstania africana CBS 2517]